MALPRVLRVGLLDRIRAGGTAEAGGIRSPGGTRAGFGGGGGGRRSRFELLGAISQAPYGSLASPRELLAGAVRRIAGCKRLQTPSSSLLLPNSPS